MSMRLHLLRQWPTSTWIEAWLSDRDIVIISEQALQTICAAPQQLTQLPGHAYVLKSELALQPQLQLPANVIQLGDARWVELSLECQAYYSWPGIDEVG